MKKQIVMAFVATLLFGGINAQAQAQASAPVASAPAAAAPAAGPLKLGYTSMDYLLSKMPEAKEIQNQLTIQKTQLENEAKRLEKEFQDKLAVYEKGAAQMSEVIRADKEKELQSLQGRVQEFQRNADTQLQQKYQQLVNPVIQKIQKNVDATAKDNGYNYVFNLDAGAGTAVILLYAPEDNNITDLVLKKMGIAPDPKPAPGAPAATPAPAPKKN
jgi:outer membrane protein